MIIMGNCEVSGFRAQDSNNIKLGWNALTRKQLLPV